MGGVGVDFRSIDAEQHNVETRIEGFVSCFYYPKGSDYTMGRVVGLERYADILGVN